MMLFEEDDVSTEQKQQEQEPVNTKWENYDVAPNATTERLPVDGGWLYYVSNQIARQTSMCFVPDVDLQRYQSHLRDAYTQGYKDGQEDAKNGIVNAP